MLTENATPEGWEKWEEWLNEEPPTPDDLHAQKVGAALTMASTGAEVVVG